ncbi:hypothetical protein [Phycicoccus sp.]|uniref:hypothetical protein n=1 Tax=Phycicoccus sp. TaxID=1902410 RepID=UPI002C17C4CC|nr:hypothetical protein [Phycicoccus sp.]HMM95360.1 hypothetical protein [Phycicoccus sp.]
MSTPAAYRFDPTKPKTVSNYPLLANRKWHPTRNLPILGGVNHITAGVTDQSAPDTSAEGTIRYGQTTTVDASWTGILDSDSIVDCLPDDYTAWAQGVSGHSFNSPFVSLEIGCGTTNWAAIGEAWREAVMTNMVIYWAPRVEHYGWPIEYQFDRDKIDWLIAKELAVGFTDHHVLNPSQRSDPFWYKGHNTFPYAEFLDRLRKALKDGVPKPTTPTYPGGSGSAKLAIDGRMGPLTVTKWQRVMGTTPDSVISYPRSELVAAVQVYLNAAGRRDKHGRKLVVDGKGILPNLSRNAGPSNTIAALQRHLGTTMDEILSYPRSNAVMALQERLNKAKDGSKKF